MIIGFIFCTLGVLHGLFKYFVIRSAARDIFNGGGVPVLDFAVIVPIWLSIGISSFLRHYQVLPFPSFGFVLYLALAVLFYGVIKREYVIGQPARVAQLNLIKERKLAEQDDGANDPQRG